MKRIITLLLAFYVLVLVFAPCVDDDFSFEPSSKPVIAGATIPVHQDQHDCCSPFCTCSCCSAPCEVLNTSFIPRIPFSHGTLAFFFYFQYRTRYDFSIWEPPKA